MEIYALTVALAAVVAAWDYGRRALSEQRRDEELAARVAKLERGEEKLHDQHQLLLTKLTATAAATSTRVPRIGVR